MPVDEYGQGHSDETPRKHADFRYFLQVHLRVVQTIQQKSPWVADEYVYVDLTSGAGMVNGEEGSPLIFVSEAGAAGLSWRGLFCEREPDTARRLRAYLQATAPESLGDHSAYTVFAADHREAVPGIIEAARELKKQAYGLIYADPNGEALPIDTLRQLAADRSLAKVDILAYVSATNYKRFRRAWTGRPTLCEDLAKIGKQYVYVRQPYAAHQWAFLFLTNWTGYPEIKKIGFHKSDSVTGAAILDRLERTAEERIGQQGLGF